MENPKTSPLILPVWDFIHKIYVSFTLVRKTGTPLPGTGMGHNSNSHSSIFQVFSSFWVLKFRMSAYFKFHGCISIMFWKYRRWTRKNIIICSDVHAEVVEGSYPLQNLLLHVGWKRIWMEATVCKTVQWNQNSGLVILCLGLIKVDGRDFLPPLPSNM